MMGALLQPTPQLISAGYEEVPLSTVSQEKGGGATEEIVPPAPPGRIRALLSRRLMEPLGVAFGTAVLLFARLMLPTPVGVADNYDGGRLLCHLSLHSAAPSDWMRQWVTFQYSIKSGADCGDPGYFGVDLPHPAYSSSQLLLLNLGHQLTQLLGLKHTALDLRVMGAVACFFIGVAIGLLFAVLRTRRLFRYLLCCALVVVVADASFIDFAASPLSEISAVIGLLYLLPAILLLFRGGRARWAGLALALAAGLFLTTSKAQMIVLAAPLALLLIAFRVDVSFLKGRIGGRVIPALAVVVLAAGTSAFTPRQDPHFTLQTKADFVFNELLYVSPDPTADMKALGVPDYYGAQIGKTAWCPPFFVSLEDTGIYNTTNRNEKYVARDRAADPALEKAMSTSNTGKFLLAHPDRAIRVANDAANAFFYVRPTYTGSCWLKHDKRDIPLGNYDHASTYDKATGHENPNVVDKRFTPVTSALGLFRDAGLTRANNRNLARRDLVDGMGDHVSLLWDCLVCNSLRAGRTEVARNHRPLYAVSRLMAACRPSGPRAPYPPSHA